MSASLRLGISETNGDSGMFAVGSLSKVPKRSRMVTWPMTTRASGSAGLSRTMCALQIYLLTYLRHTGDMMQHA